MASTAQQLITFRRELVQAGLDHDLINDLLRDASQTIVMNDGLKTTSEHTPPLGAPSEPLPPQG
ncbi:hypothetical protein [Streptomyces sp. NPDC048332]|uniref:hypothetical protein n=1 Tax=Streptomyces sp. NPDC048332 TaxID=3154619 RepID=UPI003429E3F7